MPIYSVRFRYRPKFRDDGYQNSGSGRFHKFGRVKFTALDDDHAYEKSQSLMERRHEIWERNEIWIVRVELPERMVLK